MKDHGTRIIIYNLWEDDEDHLELDFDTDLHVRFITYFSFNINLEKTHFIFNCVSMFYLEMRYRTFKLEE